MPRNRRIEYAGAHYHVFSRGVRKTDIFRCDRDRRGFLALVAEACLECSWCCLAYCLMDNHYHLVLRTDRPGLSDGMQFVNARYAERFNSAYELTGHLFQGRFHAKVIERDSYLLEVIRYIELNPVSAGMCEAAADWPWNSYGAVVGTRLHRAWFDRSAVLALFAEDSQLAVSGFAAFVAAGDRKGALPTPREAERRQRDEAIRAAHACNKHTVRSLALAFGVSTTTVLRALSPRDVPRGV